MRVIFAIVASASCALLSSCLTVADAPVAGRTRDVTVEDIKQAVVAARNAPANRGGYKIESIEIRNKDEIYLYTSHNPKRFDSIKREKGKWRYQSEGFVLEHFVPASGY